MHNEWKFHCTVPRQWLVLLCCTQCTHRCCAAACMNCRIQISQMNCIQWPSHTSPITSTTRFTLPVILLAILFVCVNNVTRLPYIGYCECLFCFQMGKFQFMKQLRLYFLMGKGTVCGAGNFFQNYAKARKLASLCILTVKKCDVSQHPGLVTNTELLQQWA